MKVSRARSAPSAAWSGDFGGWIGRGVCSQRLRSAPIASLCRRSVVFGRARPFAARSRAWRRVVSAPSAGVRLRRRARVTPDRRAGRGDGSPAAQDCRLTASEPLPGGGTRARFRRSFRLPVGDEVAVDEFALFGERVLAGAGLSERVSAGGAFAAVAGWRAGAQRERNPFLPRRAAAPVGEVPGSALQHG